MSGGGGRWGFNSTGEGNPGEYFKVFSTSWCSLTHFEPTVFLRSSAASIRPRHLLQPRHQPTPPVGPTRSPLLVHKYGSPPPPFFPFPPLPSSPSPSYIFTNRSLMLSLDEIFSLPHPAFDEGFASPPWPAPAPSPAPAPAPTPTPSSGPSPRPRPSPGLEEPHRAGLSPAEERQRRRKISNRESARRSRMRKQRHLEELRSQAGRLRSENQALADRLVATVNRCLLFNHDNDRLRGESDTLRRRLSNLRRLLLLRQHHLLSAPPPLPAPVVAFPSGYEQTLASLIA